MTDIYPRIRVSPRFDKVVRIVSQRWAISGPLVTEMILDGYGKGTLVAFGRKAELIEIIEESSRGTKMSSGGLKEEKDGPEKSKTEEHKVTEGRSDQNFEKEMTGLSPA